MPIEVDYDDFKPGASYKGSTVGALLEEMKPRLERNVFLLNDPGESSGHVLSVPTISRRSQINTLPMFIWEFMSQENRFEDGVFTLGTLVNCDGHYLSVVFKKTGSETDGELIINNPLGIPNDIGTYDEHIRHIKEAFSIYCDNIKVSLNPPEYFVGQEQTNSSGPVGIYVLEFILQNFHVQPSYELGISYNEQDVLMCNKNSPELRQSQKKKLEDYERDNMQNIKHSDSSIDWERVYDAVNTGTPASTRSSTPDSEGLNEIDYNALGALLNPLSNESSFYKTPSNISDPLLNKISVIIEGPNSDQEKIDSMVLEFKNLNKSLEGRINDLKEIVSLSYNSNSDLDSLGKANIIISNVKRNPNLSKFFEESKKTQISR